MILFTDNPGHMASYTLQPTAAIATVNTGFVCLHIILKIFTNINKITELTLQRNSMAKIKYIYLILSQNFKSKYFK